MSVSRLLLAAVLPFAVFGLLAAETPAPTLSPLVLTDPAGKELKIKKYEISAGVRHLAWLAPADEKAPKGAKTAPGPLAFAVRDEHSTTLVDGVLTLVPLPHLRGLAFDNEQKLMTVRVAVGEKEEDDVVLKGTTRFQGINKITIDAEVDRGEQGIAEVKYFGGVPKGIRAVKFESPKAAAELKPGRTAAIEVADKKDKNVQKVSNLQALYRFADGSERLLPIVMFKKTLKMDLAKVKKIEVTPGKGKDEETSWTVTGADGEEQTLVPVLKPTLDDKAATFLGLLGQVPVGWKLFPPDVIKAVEFEEAK